MISIFMYGKRVCVLFGVWCYVLGVMVCTKKIPYMSFLLLLHIWDDWACVQNGVLLVVLVFCFFRAVV